MCSFKTDNNFWSMLRGQGKRCGWVSPACFMLQDGSRTLVKHKDTFFKHPKKLSKRQRSAAQTTTGGVRAKSVTSSQQRIQAKGRLLLLRVWFCLSLSRRSQKNPEKSS